MNSDNELSKDDRRMRSGKAYRHEPARVFIRVAPKPLDLPSPITEPSAMRAAIEDYVYDPSKVRFAACAPSRLPKNVRLEARSQTASIGLLFVTIKASELRAVLHRTEEADSDLLSLLDDLSKEHKIKCTFAEIPRIAKGWNDLLFIGCVGCGVMEIPPDRTLMTLTSITWFRDSPLNKLDYEHGGKTIPLPSAAAASMRLRRDRYLSRQFGSQTAFLEGALSRADKIADAELHSAIVKLVESKAESNGKPDSG
jgi:hypothetical protein